MNKPTVRDILSAALTLLSDKSRWTQGVYARDNKNQSCYLANERACCWCLEGAIWKAALDNPYSTLDLRLEAIYSARQVAQEKHGAGCFWVNDVQGYEAALEVLKLAIENEDKNNKNPQGEDK